MKRWPIKPLGEVCSINPKLAGSDAPRPDAEVTFVPMAAVDEVSGTIARPERRRYSEVAKGYTPFTVNDVLFAKITPCMQNGKAAVASDLYGGLGFGSTEFHILRSVGSILPRWVFAFVRQPAFRSAAEASFTGSAGQQRVPADFLKTFPIPVPPLAEQERIVKLLDEADELRKLRTQADHRTAEFIPALFHEMFGDPETNPKGWPSGQLKDFGAEIRYGLGQPPEEDPEGVPLLRATNIKHGYISEIGLIRVRREAVPVSRNAFLNAEDVLIVRSGAYTGDVASVGEKWAGSVAGYDLVASPKERLTSDFIAWYLLSEFVQDRYFNGLKLRAAQPHLNSAQVSETPFFCPPLQLQREFAARVSEIRALQAEQTASRRRLEDLFQSLLHRAFRGEL